MHSSIQVLPYSFPQTNSPPYKKISSYYVLGVYIIVPATLLFAISDLWFGHGKFQRAFPQTTSWFALKFIQYSTYPHILASVFSFFDQEYIQTYKERIGAAIGTSVFLAALPMLIDIRVGMMVFAAYTTYHAVMQQAGIAGILMGGKRPYFSFWKWLAFLLFWLVIFLISADPRWLAFRLGAMNIRQVCLSLLAFLILPFGWVSFRMLARDLRPHAVEFVWFTNGMIFTMVLLYLLHYPFFAIVMSRLIHDVTAFWIYMVHDRNRNAEFLRNAFYRLFSFSQLPIAILVPTIWIALTAWSVPKINLSPTISFLWLVLAYFHYYTEGFIWKRNSPHRQSVPFEQ